jgi:hypothetical protein
MQKLKCNVKLVCFLTTISNYNWKIVLGQSIKDVLLFALVVENSWAM